jgi:hypothetical protein
MEPITLILTALATGAATAAASVGKEAIQDAYQGLKKLIQEKYAAANTGIELIEKDPESSAFQAAAKELLEPTGAAEDPEVIQAAQELMAKAEPAKAAEGQYNVQVGGNVYGMVQGNQGEVEMTFNFGKE